MDNAWQPGEMTDWFPPHVKPFHVGIYQVQWYDWRVRWAHWDGNAWGPAGPDHATARRWARLAQRAQHKTWRGLKVK